MEIWKDIKGFDFTYLISNYGKIQKIENEKSTILKIYDNGIGYKMVSMKQNSKYKMQYIHRLVAECFLDNPNNLREVNHIDFDKANNNLSNIEWCDRQKNMDHYYNNNTIKRIGIKRNILNFKHKKSLLIDELKNNKWRLRLRDNGKRIHIGTYNSYQDALNKKISLSL